jgi:hypothetical protein
MKKKWIVIPALVLAAIGTVAPAPGLQRIFKLEQEEVLDHAMRVKVIDTLAVTLDDLYVFPDKGEKMAAILRQRLREGSYDGVKSGYLLGRQLTADLRTVVRDVHLEVRYHPKLELREREDGPAPATQAEWEQRTSFFGRMIEREQALRGVLRVGHLGGNVGYLKIASFPEAHLLADKFASVMDELADTDGLILDLRENHRGDPRAVALMISYFVDRRTRLNDIWDRKTGNTIQHWTEDKLDGKRYGGRKPVLILAGPRTGSGGEVFVYTMQALGRATVVGERTWGGAHPAALHRIGGHFFAQIPSQRSISPITHGNWEGVGVIPDVDATAEQALVVARELMRRRLQASAALAAAAP